MKKIYTLFSLMLLLGAKAQSLYPNFDFSTGTLANWTFSLGSRGTNNQNISGLTLCTSTISTNCGVSILDTVITKTMYCNLSTISPSKSRYLLSAFPQSPGVTMASYQFTVNGMAPVINVQRMVYVTSDLSHTLPEESFFQISIKDMSGNILPGASEKFTVTTNSATAIGSIPGLSHCIPWGTFTYNLNAYVGQTLRFEMVTTNCAFSGHTCSGLINGYFTTLSGIKESDLDNNIHIFPNPSSEFIFIKTPNEDEMKMLIYDIQGRLLIESYSNKISISDLQNGMYILRAIGQKSSYTKTFIKE